jgi:hypothetical protein
MVKWIVKRTCGNHLLVYTIVERRIEMQVPERVWIVIEHKADGTEDADGFEFETPQKAHGRMSDLIREADEKKTGSSFYVTSVTWLHEV